LIIPPELLCVDSSGNRNQSSTAYSMTLLTPLPIYTRALFAE
jgi:hypothetical protein